MAERQPRSRFRSRALPRSAYENTVPKQREREREKFFPVTTEKSRSPLRHIYIYILRFSMLSNSVRFLVSPLSTHSFPFFPSLFQIQNFNFWKFVREFFPFFFFVKTLAISLSNKLGPVYGSREQSDPRRKLHTRPHEASCHEPHQFKFQPSGCV